MWRYVIPGVLLIGWVVLGDPKNDVANWIWPNTPAPWEEVDGVFYPDRNDLSVYEKIDGFADLDACRVWAENKGRGIGDPNIAVGDYECGFGFIRDFSGLKVYRNTVR